MFLSLLLIVTSTLVPMQEIEVETAHISQEDLRQLAHHIASMTILLKSKTHLNDGSDVSLPLSYCELVCESVPSRNPYLDEGYVNFVRKQGHYDSGRVIRALKGDENLDRVLESYIEKTLRKYNIYKHVAVEAPLLAKVVEDMLPPGYSTFFKNTFPDLKNSHELWLASRLTLLEYMRHLNEIPCSAEKCADFCDNSTSCGPGVCTGLGLASCLSGNFLSGALLMFIGSATCLTFKGCCIHDLNLHCAYYWQDARVARDLKLSKAIDTLLLQKIKS